MRPTRVRPRALTLAECVAGTIWAFADGRLAACDHEGITGCDIIGDVYGCATHLTDLLAAPGYQVNDRTASYAHPERQAIYVGDLIDRGSEQLRM